MTNEFVLTRDEADVIRASGDFTPYYELASSTQMMPSRVRAAMKTLADKKLTVAMPDILQLTPDGLLVKRLLREGPRTSRYGRVHIIDKDDPEKGRWGGLSERNGRRLTACVQKAFGGDDWFAVDLRVESTDADRPLTGQVVFHLHPTLYPNTQTVIAVDNVAKLGVFAYGAFTVGVEADEGATQLELDLSELSDAPERFRAA